MERRVRRPMRGEYNPYMDMMEEFYDAWVSDGLVYYSYDTEFDFHSDPEAAKIWIEEYLDDYTDEAVERMATTITDMYKDDIDEMVEKTSIDEFVKEYYIEKVEIRSYFNTDSDFDMFSLEEEVIRDFDGDAVGKVNEAVERVINFWKDDSEKGEHSRLNCFGENYEKPDYIEIEIERNDGAVKKEVVW